MKRLFKSVRADLPSGSPGCALPVNLAIPLTRECYATNLGIDICAAMRMTADDLFEAWESFSFTKKLPKVPTVENLTKYLDNARKTQPIKSEVGSGYAKFDSPISNGHSRPSGASTSSMDVDETVQRDAKNVKKRAREVWMEPVKTDSDFSTRKDRAKLDASFLGIAASKTAASGATRHVDVALHDHWKEYGPKDDETAHPDFRWNYNWETDTVETLTSRRDRLSRLIMEFGNLTPPEAGQSGQVEAVYAGTISTGSATGSKMDRKDIYLRRPDLKPIKLDLTELQNLSLFRGQVVALTGTNPQDRRLITHNLYTIALPEPRLFDNWSSERRSRALSLMVAAGPYTCAEDLTYEPLFELLRQAKLRKPAVLILMGPFVDEKHPLIASGRAQQTFPALFGSVMEKIQEFCGTNIPNTKLVIAPSLNDVSHRSVLPQTAFRRSAEPDGRSTDFHFRDEVARVPNPCVLRVNDLDFGLTSVDVINALDQNSIVTGTNNADRYTAYVSFVLNQQSFFPIWPPPDDVHIDMNHAERGLTLPSLPDALLFASTHHPFIRTVNGVLAINVGRLLNEGTSGCFADVQIAQSPLTSTSIVQRAHVEIVRI